MNIPVSPEVVEKRGEALADFFFYQNDNYQVKAYNFFMKLFENSAIGIVGDNTKIPHSLRPYSAINFGDPELNSYLKPKLRSKNNTNPLLIPSAGADGDSESFLHEFSHILELDDEERYRLRLPNLGMNLLLPSKFMKHRYKSAWDREINTFSIQLCLAQNLNLMDIGFRWSMVYSSLDGLGRKYYTKDAQKLIIKKCKTLSLDNLVENWYQKDKYIRRYWKGLTKIKY